MTQPTPPKQRNLPKQRKFIQKRGSYSNFAKTFSRDEVQTLGELFDECDGDKDGLLNLEELSDMTLKLNIHCSEDEIKRLFHELDTNSINAISFEDFVEGIQWIQKARSISESGDFQVADFFFQKLKLKLLLKFKKLI